MTKKTKETLKNVGLALSPYAAALGGLWYYMKTHPNENGSKMPLDPEKQYKMMKFPIGPKEYEEYVKRQQSLSIPKDTN